MYFCKVEIEFFLHQESVFDELEPTTNAIMDANLCESFQEFNSTIPWRFCFAGGWMDLKWCNELYPGSVITLNFKFQGGICKDMCGLATSSRKFWRKLWNGKVPTYLEAPEAAKFLYGAENFKHFGKAIGTMPEWEKTSYSAGTSKECIIALLMEHVTFDQLMLCEYRQRRTVPLLSFGMFHLQCP